MFDKLAPVPINNPTHRKLNDFFNEHGSLVGTWIDASAHSVTSMQI